MKRRPWTNDELVKTLALYCQIPFGKMHSRNPAVVALASIIDRTPSAVALKLVNFASLDPNLQGRGVGGMGNISRADRAAWMEFYGKWEALADYSSVEVSPEMIRSPLYNRSQAAPAGPTELTRDVKVRRGQAFFRAAVLSAYDGQCCITGITSPELLRASHIVPWSQNPALRLDPCNGLCLNALHDAAFDRGLITLTEKFELCISTRLKREVPNTVYKEMFERRSGTLIRLPERFKPSMEMLEYHRSKVFCS